MGHSWAPLSALSLAQTSQAFCISFLFCKVQVGTRGGYQLEGTHVKGAHEWNVALPPPPPPVPQTPTSQHRAGLRSGWSVNVIK